MLALFGIGFTEMIVVGIVLGILIVPVAAVVIVAVVASQKPRRD